MFVEKIIFVASSNNITGADEVANFNTRRREVPFFMLIERRQLDSSGDKHGLRLLGDFFERSLNSVENGGQDTRTKLDRELGASSEDGVSDGDAG